MFAAFIRSSRRALGAAELLALPPLPGQGRWTLVAGIPKTKLPNRCLPAFALVPVGPPYHWPGYRFAILWRLRLRNAAQRRRSRSRGRLREQFVTRVAPGPSPALDFPLALASEGDREWTDLALVTP